MKDYYLSVRNWEKYQARSDKELPWFKTYGSLFTEQWFQSLTPDTRFLVALFMDLARKNGNKVAVDWAFVCRFYGLPWPSDGLRKRVNTLIKIGFLYKISPTGVRLDLDKIRQDKSGFASLSDKNSHEKTKAEERYERLTGKKIPA